MLCGGEDKKRRGGGERGRPDVKGEEPGSQDVFAAGMRETGEGGPRGEDVEKKDEVFCCCRGERERRWGADGWKAAGLVEQGKPRYQVTYGAKRAQSRLGGQSAGNQWAPTERSLDGGVVVEMIWVRVAVRFSAELCRMQTVQTWLAQIQPLKTEINRCDGSH